MMGRGGSRRVKAVNLPSQPHRPPRLSEDHEDLHGPWSFTRPMGASMEPYQARGLRPSTSSHQVQTTTDFRVRGPFHDSIALTATSAKACTKNRGVCASGKRHRATARSINQGLHASAVACAHRPTTRDIGEGLHASDVACAHLANDVGNRHGASAKACTHKPWRVRIDWASTAVACTHRPTTGDYTSICRCRTWPGSIVSGLQNAVSRRRTWNAHNGQPRQNWAGTIVSGLHISVSRCRTGLPQ
uniref:Uncharacterized protein n=1 Tax=Solanum tuberosum TaxID=4113 RepID=M1DE94_SOLTU